MSAYRNLASEQTRRELAMQKLAQDYAELDTQAREDADQAAYLAEWQRTHPAHSRPLTRHDVLAFLGLLALTAAILSAPWWLPAAIDWLGLAGR